MPHRKDAKRNGTKINTDKHRFFTTRYARDTKDTEEDILDRIDRINKIESSKPTQGG